MKALFITEIVVSIIFFIISTYSIIFYINSKKVMLEIESYGNDLREFKKGFRSSALLTIYFAIVLGLSSTIGFNKLSVAKSSPFFEYSIACGFLSLPGFFLTGVTKWFKDTVPNENNIGSFLMGIFLPILIVILLGGIITPCLLIGYARANITLLLKLKKTAKELQPEESSQVEEKTEVPKVSKPKEQQPVENNGPVMLKSPINATVVSVNVSGGQLVKKAEKLVTLEMSGMQTWVYAPRDGVVAQIMIFEGQSLSEGDSLVELY